MSQTSYPINHNDAILGMLADSAFKHVESMICKESIKVGKGVVKVVGEDDQVRLPGANKGVLAFDGDFVASNTIDLDINGTAITQVDFDTDQATTLEALRAEIESNDDVSSAVSTGAREITVYGVDGTDISITNIVVAAGASQANGTFTAGTNDSLFGFASRTQILESGLPGTDEVPAYVANDVANILREGKIWVQCETAFNPDTDTLYFRFLANGALEPGDVRNDTDSGKAVAVTGNYAVRNRLSAAGLLLVELNKPN